MYQHMNYVSRFQINTCNDSSFSIGYEAEINQQLTGHGSVADTEGWKLHLCARVPDILPPTPGGWSGG